MRTILLVVACLLGLSARASLAAANGRFPNASYVIVGPGASSDVIALRTTFGLLISRDAGAHFYWLCEDAMYYPAVVGPQVDPALGILSDGSVFFGFEYGIHSTATGCRVDEHPEVYTRTISDLVTDREGENIWAIQATRAASNHVYHASRTALRFEALGSGVQNMEFSTLEVAPSNLRRIYAAGLDEIMRLPRLYRSDDGGETLTLMRPDLTHVDDLWLSGVDPTNPDVVYFRASVGLGTWLLKSRDGGASVTHVASTRDPMLGFAISDDGRTVWVGSINDGLLRSDDGGETFVNVNREEVLCLRQHAGVLWRCSNWVRSNYALSKSEDRGGSFRGVLRFDDVVGPYECAMPSEGQRYCVERWPAQRDMIATAAMNLDADVVVPIDAVPLDSGRDVPVAQDAPRDAGMDAARPDATVVRPPPPASNTGLCAAGIPGSNTRGTPCAAGLTLLALAVCSRRRR